MLLLQAIKISRIVIKRSTKALFDQCFVDEVWHQLSEHYKSQVYLKLNRKTDPFFLFFDLTPSEQNQASIQTQLENKGFHRKELHNNTALLSTSASCAKPDERFKTRARMSGTREAPFVNLCNIIFAWMLWRFHVPPKNNQTHPEKKEKIKPVHSYCISVHCITHVKIQTSLPPSPQHTDIPPQPGYIQPLSLVHKKQGNQGS